MQVKVDGTIIDVKLGLIKIIKESSISIYVNGRFLNIPVSTEQKGKVELILDSNKNALFAIDIKNNKLILEGELVV